MEIDRFSMDLQPVVLLQRLSEKEIKFHTRRAPNRRSGRRRKESTRSLKDEQHVDFSYFEEYRRSRNTYLKRNERKKKSTKSRGPKKKKANVVQSISGENDSYPASNALINLVLGSNDVNKVKNVKEKKQKPKRKSGSEAKAASPKKRFKRMVIESDSDCSVENYGIVYCNEGNVPFSNEGDSSSISNCFSQNSFVSSSLPFNSPIQTSVSCSPNISPPCSEVIVNENDILSALDCEADDEFYNKVIQDKFHTLDSYKRIDSNELLDYLSGSSRDGNEAYSDCHSGLSENASSLPAFARLSQPINVSLHSESSPSAISKSTTIGGISKSKLESYDVIKESCDVVSRIMQDMDQEFQKRRKLLPDSAKHPRNKETSESLNGKKKKSGPPYMVLLNHKDDASSNEKRNSDCSKAPSSVSSEVVAVVETLKRNVCSSVSREHKIKQIIAPKKTVKMVEFCSKCHKIFSQVSAGETVCSSCLSVPIVPEVRSTRSCDKSLEMRGKLQKKKFKTPKKPSLCSNKTPFKGRLSPLKMKKTGFLRSVRREIVKKLTSGDRQRLLYKQASTQKHLKGTKEKEVEKQSRKGKNIASTYDSTNETDTNSSERNVKKKVELIDTPSNNEGILPEELPKQKFKTKGQSSKNKCEISRDKKKRCEQGSTSEVFTQSKPNPIEEFNKCKDDDSHLDKSGFTLKSIEKGLMLMTFPEPDKELNMSFDSHSEDESGNAAVANEQPAAKENSGESSGSRQQSSLTGSMTAQQVINSNKLHDIEYRYMLPPGPTLIVAHYSKASEQSSDFHLSRVSYQNKISGQYKSLPVTTECSVPPVPNNNLTNALPFATDGGGQISPLVSMNTPMALTHSSSDSLLTQESPTEPVKETTVPPKTCSALVPYTGNGRKSPTTENSNGESRASGSFVHQRQQNEIHRSSAISLVLHELDAIAILSILDLEGNEQHSNKLLENLLMKEIEELQKLKELCHETLEEDLKKIAVSKSQAKLGRIKSLNIARSLSKKYGKLSNIVEAIISKSSESISNTTTTVTTTTTTTATASVVQSVQQIPSLPHIAKLEKNATLSDCALGRVIGDSQQNIQPHLQNSSNSMLGDQNSLQIPSYRTASSVVSSPSPNIIVKPEMPRTSSSCVLGSLLSPSVTASSIQQYANAHPEFSLPTSALHASAANQRTSPFLLSNLTNPEVQPSQTFPQMNPAVPFSTIFNALTPPATRVNTSVTPVSSHSVPTATGSTLPSASPVNVKAEVVNTLSSCQLQGQSRPPVNLFNYTVQNPLVPQTISNIVSNPLEQQSAIVPYRPILPAGLVSKADSIPCPNRTVPFTPNPLLAAMNMNRSLVPVNYTANKPTVSMSIATSPVRVQQVVLSNVQAMAAQQQQQQNRFTVAPYNYTMPQQPVVNSQQLISRPPMHGVYTLYPSSVPTSQVVCQPVGVQQSQNIRVTTASPQVTTVSPNITEAQMKNCVVCNKPPTMRCKQCAKVVYCSTDCAKLYWNRRHRTECQSHVT